MRLHDGMIGLGVGDNATFVWNFWWMRQVIAGSGSPFWTPALFAPIGTSLVLHTTTLLPTLATTALLPHADALTAYNIAILVAVFLNGLCTYAAAYAVTRASGPSIVAGLVFASSPFLAVRLQGHFNVLSAWGLPLLVLTMVKLCQRKSSLGHAMLVAGVLALLAYTDYYAFVFGLAFVLLYLVLEGRELRMIARPLTPTRRWTLRLLATLLILLIAAIVAIEMIGGTELIVAGVHVSARSTFNLRSTLWLLTLLALIVWRLPRLQILRTSQDLPPWPRPWRSLAAGALVLLVLLTPLLIEAARAIAQHDYASQTYLWRSAPPGIDAGTLLLGNPAHPLYGAAVRGVYARLGIHPIESVAWLGLVPIACLIFAATRLRTQPEVRRWLVLIGVFGIWALGPFLMLFGANTGFILPQTMLRFVPLLSNARIPGRAFIFVILGVAMIVALALASLAGHPRRRMLTAFAALLILADFWPAPQPIVTLDRPPLYTTLRAQPPGPVLDLPLGLRDGFGERGHLDHRALFYQTLHQHPIAGGFVARLSPRLQQTYEADPVLGALLSGTPPKPGATLACAFRYVILPKDAPADSRDTVTRVFQLERLDGDDTRDLYRAACRKISE